MPRTSGLASMPDVSKATGLSLSFGERKGEKWPAQNATSLPAGGGGELAGHLPPPLSLRPPAAGGAAGAAAGDGAAGRADQHHHPGARAGGRGGAEWGVSINITTLTLEQVGRGGGWAGLGGEEGAGHCVQGSVAEGCVVGGREGLGWGPCAHLLPACLNPKSQPHRSTQAHTPAPTDCSPHSAS